MHWPLFAMLTALAGEPADMDVPGLNLAWDAPTRCPDGADVQRRVRAYLAGGRPSRAIDAKGIIDRSDAQWRLRLTFDGQTKILLAPRCGDLAEAASVILSLAWVSAAPLVEGHSPRSEPIRRGLSRGPIGVADEPIPSDDDPQRSHSVDGPRRLETPALAASGDAKPRSPASARGLLRIQGALGVGITPTMTIARVAAGVVWPRARFEVLGKFWAPAVGDNGWITLGTAGLQGCHVLHGRSLLYPICLGGELGAMRTSGGHHDLWGGAHASGALLWEFHPNWGLWAGVEFVLAWLQPEAAGPGRVAIHAGLGLEFYFPSRTRRVLGKRKR